MSDEMFETGLAIQLTEEHRDAIIAYVEGRGRARAAKQGSAFSEVDYLVGAASVFFALGWHDRLPAAWIFGPLTGRTVLDPS